MPVFWTEPWYLLLLGAWIAGLVRVLVMLLRRRRLIRTANGPVKKWPLQLGLSLWMLAALLTSCEVVFVLFVDSTDAFNATNVSKRWFRRHVEPHRNSGGFRDDREFSKVSPPDVHRIAFVGDSFTIAQGVGDHNDRFTELVEKRLNVAGEKKFHVHNLGEFGWDVSLIEGMIKALVQEDYELDTIVYVYMMNDIEGYDPRTEEVIKKIQTGQPKFFLWSNTYFFNWLYFRWQQYQAGRTVEYFPHLADSYKGPVWLNVRASLLRMKKLCSGKGIDFRIVVFPFLHNFGPDYAFGQAHENFRQFAADTSVPVLDLEPILKAHADEGLMVNAFDNHPNERCHAIVAEEIFEKLLADLADVESSSTGDEFPSSVLPPESSEEQDDDE